MNHPYRKYEGSDTWYRLDAELSALEGNGDIELRTAREYVIGALCQRLNTSISANQSASATIQRSADGAIINAGDLTANELAGEMVMCPACEAIVFQMWPEGWDAHAAHRCSGVSGSTTEARKAHFRQRFARLFR